MDEPQEAVTIAVPVAEVFDYLADGGNDPAWMVWVSDCSLNAYGGGVGASYTQWLSSSPLRQRQLSYRVVNFHRPSTLGREATSLRGRPRARFQLRPIGGGTTAVALVFQALNPEADPPRPGSVAHWMSQLRMSLPRLKQALEAASVSSTLGAGRQRGAGASWLSDGIEKSPGAGPRARSGF